MLILAVLTVLLCCLVLAVFTAYAPSVDCVGCVFESTAAHAPCLYFDFRFRILVLGFRFRVGTAAMACLSECGLVSW